MGEKGPSHPSFKSPAVLGLFVGMLLIYLSRLLCSASEIILLVLGLYLRVMLNLAMLSHKPDGNTWLHQLVKLGFLSSLWI